MVFTHEDFVDLAVREVRRLADVAAEVDLGAPAPTCGDWTVADVLVHTGEIHRWAARLVREVSPTRIPRSEIDWGVPAATGDLPAWIDAGAGPLRDAFLPADPDAEMWAWGVPKQVRFWPRRMVHETGVHRADVELAAGRTPTFDATVAADGIDELLDNLPPASYFAPGVAELRGDGEVVGLVATDLADTAWRITLEPNGFGWTRAPRADVEPAADALVAAPAGTLLLAAYGRVDIDPAGSTDLWDHWRTHSAI